MPALQGLADLALEAGLVNDCLATQLYRYAIGRTELDEVDLQAVSEALGAVGGSGADFPLDALLLQIASSEAFGYRREVL